MKDLLIARKEWFERCLSEKHKNHWAGHTELYREYIDEILEREEGGESIDQPSAESFRKWLGETKFDFAESRLFKRKGANQIRKYRFKQEQPTCIMSALGKKATQLKGVLFNGSPNH